MALPFCVLFVHIYLCWFTGCMVLDVDNGRIAYTFELGHCLSISHVYKNTSMSHNGLILLGITLKYPCSILK
jgi:hypothetical protein